MSRKLTEAEVVAYIGDLKLSEVPYFANTIRDMIDGLDVIAGEHYERDVFGRRIMWCALAGLPVALLIHPEQDQPAELPDRARGLP